MSRWRDDGTQHRSDQRTRGHTTEKQEAEDMTQEEAEKEIIRLLRFAAKGINKLERDKRIEKRSFSRWYEWGYEQSDWCGKCRGVPGKPEETK